MVAGDSPARQLPLYVPRAWWPARWCWPCWSPVARWRFPGRNRRVPISRVRKELQPARRQRPRAQPAVEPLPDSPSAARPQDAQNAAGQSGAAQSLPQSQQDGNQKPVGTAAAETATTTGFAASKPAGAALAPAKQKRSRTILISVGAIAGAAVALGLVVALSKGTPSKPPGSQ